MGEGSLYAPDLAALALKQAAGDTLEAAFMLRAYRATKPRLGYTIPQSTTEMRLIRRISAAFKDVPGGQILGAATDYTLRLLDFELLDDSSEKRKTYLQELFNQIHEVDPLPESFPKVIEILRQENLLVAKAPADGGTAEIFDLTRQSLTYPVARSTALQAMARGETGGLLLLAYSSMRGYGDIHPAIAELRVGFLPVKIKSPDSGEPRLVGEVKLTEAEVIARYTSQEGSPKFTLGYGLCFGHNEIKAISMAILDRTMQAPDPQLPCENQEFVLSHIDGIESMGFCNHWRLPHYVTFQSDLDRLRKTRQVMKTEDKAVNPK
jgi:alpha-D-ribose 1-methylphosphonate 5-triphosphate synthase subunit PhnI